MINNDKADIYRNVKTIIGNENQITREIGGNFIVRANSTFNQLFKVFPDTVPNASRVPTIRYLALGSGGMAAQNCSASSANLPPEWKFFKHDPRSTGLFNPTPVVLREINNDLTAAERQRYALRALVEYNGVKYYAYYLIKIDMAKVKRETKIFYKTVSGEMKSEDYVPKTSDLKPQAQEYTPDQEELLKASYSKTLAAIEVVITPEDVREIKNVFSIIHGNPNRAITTEMALVSGEPYPVQIDTSAGKERFDEVIAAQVCHINSTMIPYEFYNQGIKRVMNLAISEPLMVFEKK